MKHVDLTSNLSAWNEWSELACTIEHCLISFFWWSVPDPHFKGDRPRITRSIRGCGGMSRGGENRCLNIRPPPCWNPGSAPEFEKLMLFCVWQDRGWVVASKMTWSLNRIVHAPNGMLSAVKSKVGLYLHKSISLHVVTFFSPPRREPMCWSMALVRRQQFDLKAWKVSSCFPDLQFTFPVYPIAIVELHNICYSFYRPRSAVSLQHVWTR